MSKKIQRAPDWPELLAEFLSARSLQTFAWGTHDCALFACDAVRAMTGVDLAEDFRFTYSSELGAAKAMRKFAGGGLTEVVEKMAAAHGIAEVPVLMAQRGDVVLVNTEAGPALGVVSMNGWRCLSAGRQGLVTTDLDECVKAWRIP